MATVIVLEHRRARPSRAATTALVAAAPAAPTDWQPIGDAAAALVQSLTPAQPPQQERDQ